MEASQVVQQAPSQNNSPSENEGANAFNVDVAKQNTRPEPKQEAQEAVEQQEPKKYKKTIFGKPVEFTLDQVKNFFQLDPDVIFDEKTEKAYIDAYLKNRAGDLKFNDIDHKRREIDQFYNKLKSDMPSLLKEAGIDPTEWALQYLNKQAEEMQMDPREVEYRRMQEERQAWEYQKQLEAETLQQQQLEAETNKHYEKYMQQMGVALTKAQIPQNETFIISRAAEHLMQQKEMGLDLSFEEAVQFAEQDFAKTAQRMFRKMEPQKVAQLLGDDVMRKLRGMELQKVTPISQPKSQNLQPQQEQRPMTRDEFEKWKQDKIKQLDGR
jgi:hypothetical protein